MALLNNLLQYLEATSKHLGVERERYGSGYRAIIAHRDCVDFLFDRLEGDDNDGTQVQMFFAENPLFPSGYGLTPSEALHNLDDKLGALYSFVETGCVYKFRAEPKFKLEAGHDCALGEDQTFYEVCWDDIIRDLNSTGTYFYEQSKEKATVRECRNLHALLNFEYTDEFKALN